MEARATAHSGGDCAWLSCTCTAQVPALHADLEAFRDESKEENAKKAERRTAGTEARLLHFQR